MRQTISFFSHLIVGLVLLAPSIAFAESNGYKNAITDRRIQESTAQKLRGLNAQLIRLDKVVSEIVSCNQTLEEFDI